MKHFLAEWWQVRGSLQNKVGDVPLPTGDSSVYSVSEPIAISVSVVEELG